MVKTFDCAKCRGNHARPIDRNCKELKSATMEPEGDTNSLILKELKNLTSRMTQMEDKVQSLEVSRSPSVSTSSRSPASSISSRRHQEDQEEDLILLSLNSLRTSKDIQDQVDARIRDLQAAPEKGKLKSQRGGSETVFVKKEVPWPQNFILGGSTRARFNYDSLSISQWVSGFATIVKDEKNPEIKQNMLEYLSDIMEDSHDFGWGQLRGPMLSFSVKWRRAGLIGLTPQKLTGSDGPMPIKFKIKLITVPVQRKIWAEITQHHVNFFRKALALIR